MWRRLVSVFNLVRDLRYAARTLARSPGFALAASFILALGIAATTTTFSIANAVLFRPLPFSDPEQLVSVFEWTPRGNREGVSPATFLDWRAQNRCFTNLATSRGLDINFTGAGEPEQLGGASVSQGMFEMLGSGPALGRGFHPDDYGAGASRVVMLSHGFWRRRFAGDRNALGKVIQLGGEPYTIVGIMPANFWFFWGRMDVWTPLRFTNKDLANRGGRASLMTIGRLKRGVGLGQAQAEMEALASRLLDRHRDMTGWGVRVRPLREQDAMVRRARPALLLLLAAVGVVMLIVCANLANLLLVRGSGRASEMAIRSALGARRKSLIAQLLIESLVLAAIGGGLGALLSVWGTRFTSTLIPEDLRLSLPSGPDQIGLNTEVLLFTLAMSLATGLLFGLAPALQFSKPNLAEALKAGGRAASQGARQRRLRDVLAAAEIALSLALLIAATLLLESYARMYRRDLGYRPEGAQAMLLLGIKQQPAGEIVRRVTALPGVEAAGLVSSLPGWPMVWPFDFRRIDVEGAAGESSARALYSLAAYGYFDAMGFTLLRGRGFTEDENLRERYVTVVNQELAKRYSLGLDPIGKRVRPTDSPPGPWLTVVGMVSDERHPLSGEPMPALYRPGVQQAPQYLIVRGSAELGQTIRRRIWSVAPDQPVLALGSMDKVVAEARSPVRFGLVLLGAFATAALALAAMGIYAVMAYIVKARSHEIGVRVALGARKSDILGLVLGRALGVAVGGVVAGIPIAWAGARALSRMLHGISATDPVTFCGVSLFLVMVSIAAAYFPARRAASIDPMCSLKYE